MRTKEPFKTGDLTNGRPLPPMYSRTLRSDLTPEVRLEIAHSDKSVEQLAKEYKIARSTVSEIRKVWRD